MAAGKSHKRKSISHSLLLDPKFKKRKSSHRKEHSCSLLSRLLDASLVSERQIVSYLRKRDGSVLKEGQITRDGVLCNCCGHVFLLSSFEVHAGSTLHRPSANMFLRDGRSIAECQMQLGHHRPSVKHVKPVAQDEDTDMMDTDDDGNDNVCHVCGDGGELMLCDSCPSAFHAGCIDLESIPEGDWYCFKCRCGHCGGKCFSEEAAKTILCCAQCDVYYHRACLKPNRSHEFEGQWFCGQHCKDVFQKTRRLVGAVNPLENGLHWMLLRSREEDEGSIPISKKAVAENQSRLSTALDVLNECFDPIVDYETNTDLLSQTLFNRKSKSRRLNCTGFYTILLGRADQVICVATFRIHGSSVAEMPFIGTRHQFRQQGMCRQLMIALETMLRGIGVYRLILPAVPDLLETWIGAFGFSHLRFSLRKEVSKLNLMSFPGTTLLQKRLLSSEALQSNDQSLKQVETTRNGDSSTPGKFYFKVRELHQTKGPYSNGKPTSLHASQLLVC